MSKYLVGESCECEVASNGVSHSLGMSGAAGSVKQEKEVLRVQFLSWAFRTRTFHSLT